MFSDSIARVKSPARHLEEPDSSLELLLRTLIANSDRGRALRFVKLLNPKLIGFYLLISTEIPLYKVSVQIKYGIQLL